MEPEIEFPFKRRAGQIVVCATLEEIQAATEFISQVDLRTTSIDELKGLIAPLFKGYKIIIPILPVGISLYRMRFFPDERPEFVSGLGAPPASAVLKDQRCNRSGEPMFYCSNARQAVFFEMHPSVGQRYVLSEWKTIKRILVNNVGYSASAFETLKSKREVPTWEPSGKSDSETEANRKAHEFLADKFTQDIAADEEHLYKLTIAVTERLIHGGPFDGLMYPTIRMWANADNLALKPDSASNALRFARAEYVEMTKINGPEMTFNVLDTATSLATNGAIVWKGHPDRWTTNPGGQLEFTAQDGRWTARDALGNIVDPD